MAESKQTYEPLARNGWRRLGKMRAWRSADHLLIIETHFWSEHYTRFFWADIQTLLLYQLNSRSFVLLALEIICLGAVLIPVIFWDRGWPLGVGLLFPLIYAAWRFRRPGWACAVATRTNQRQFALPGKYSSCRTIVEDLKNRVILAQGALHASAMEDAGSATPVAQAAVGKGPKQPVLAVHVIAFVLGVLSPFSGFIFALYCGMLIAAWFAQRDFRFPFAVRSAAVMSQILAFLRIGIWVLVNSHVRSDFAPVIFNHWQFGLPQVLFSLYGIMAVYWYSLERAKPQQKSATVLGLS